MSVLSTIKFPEPSNMSGAWMAIRNLDGVWWSHCLSFFWWRRDKTSWWPHLNKLYIWGKTADVLWSAFWLKHRKHQSTFNAKLWKKLCERISIPRPSSEMCSAGKISAQLTFPIAGNRTEIKKSESIRLVSIFQIFRKYFCHTTCMEMKKDKFFLHW